jgi:hypothetical protein
VHGFIRQFHMQGVAVGVGVHGHGGDAHIAGGAHHATGDFTAVGN